MYPDSVEDEIMLNAFPPNQNCIESTFIGSDESRIPYIMSHTIMDARLFYDHLQPRLHLLEWTAECFEQVK